MSSFRELSALVDGGIVHPLPLACFKFETEAMIQAFNDYNVHIVTQENVIRALGILVGSDKAWQANIDKAIVKATKFINAHKCTKANHEDQSIFRNVQKSIARIDPFP